MEKETQTAVLVGAVVILFPMLMYVIRFIFSVSGENQLLQTMVVTTGLGYLAYSFDWMYKEAKYRIMSL